MAYIEDIEKKASELLKQMGLDWLGNQLDPETSFKVVEGDDAELVTALNYMVWRGWVERLPLDTNDKTISAWELTPEGQRLAMSHLHGLKPQATPEPSRGRSCPY